MQVERCGAELWIVRDLPCRPAVLARWLNENLLSGFREAVAAYDTLGIHIEPVGIDAAVIEAALSRLEPLPQAPKRHRVPICYALAVDREMMCAHLGLAWETIIEFHSSAVYRCEAVGFCPGFPYLSGLPSEIGGVPRLAEPRLRVPAGSVGVTGAQCGIYPTEVPGGWNLIGRTPLTICDPAKRFFPIEAGDEIVFESISENAYEAWLGEPLGVTP